MDKKKKFVEKEKPKKGLKPVHIVGILVLAIIAGSYFGSSGQEKAEKITVAEEQQDASAVKEPDSLYIKVSDVSDAKAHFFEYPSNTGKTIRFFVLKSSDGIFRAAFDACDVCYREKRGYRQEGDYMVCNNCGRKFPSNLINVEQGGCNPAPLQRTIEDLEHNPVALTAVITDGYVVIKKSDIESGAKYF